MDRVATFNSYQSVLSNLMRAQSRQVEAQTQVTSGKKASDLQGFGRDAESITAAKTLKSRVEGYIDTASMLAAKLSAQNLAMSEVESAAQNARDAIANAVATGRGDGLMASLDSALSQAVQALNTRHSGQFLFGGGNDSQPPVAADGLSDLTTAGAPAALFSNGGLVPSAKLDEATTIETGYLAEDLGLPLFTALGQIQAFDAGAGGPFGANLTQAQSDFLTGLLSTFDAVRTGATEAVAKNGLTQNRVDEAKAMQEDRQVMLEALIGDLADVDMAEAVSRLQQAQTAVQASAQVFATLKDVSLLDYLR